MDTIVLPPIPYVSPPANRYDDAMDKWWKQQHGELERWREKVNHLLQRSL